MFWPPPSPTRKSTVYNLNPHIVPHHFGHPWQLATSHRFDLIQKKLSTLYIYVADCDFIFQLLWQLKRTHGTWCCHTHYHLVLQILLDCIKTLVFVLYKLGWSGCGRINQWKTTVLCASLIASTIQYLIPGNYRYYIHL